jgi:hypothetical protein
MGLRRIAYTMEESALLTIDGKTLLAHDGLVGAPRWKLEFAKPLAGVLFASPSSIPREADAGPWRSAATTSQAIAFDDETMHIIDARVGSIVSTIALGGPATAAAVGPDSLAVGVGANVLMWREGTKHELSYRAKALAFSPDGKTLAIGLAKGDIVLLDAATRTVKNTQECTVAPISDLSPARDGSFIATGERGMAHVQLTECSKYLNGSINAATLNRAGDVLAIHRSVSSVVLYGWPPSSPLARITTTTRAIDDIAFGTEDRLGVSLGQGDANMIDPVTLEMERTEVHDGRKRHSWLITAESERERTARTSQNTNYGPSSTGSGGGKWKVGGLVSLALIALRLILALGRSSSSSYSTWTPPPNFGALTALDCSHDCEHDRLVALKAECDRSTMTEDCVKDAADALKAFDEDRCDDARAAINRIATTVGADMHPDPLVSSKRLMADLGLKSACGMAVTPRVKANPMMDLVRYTGPDLTPRVDVTVPFGQRETIAMWAAPDGTLVVARSPLAPATAPCMIYRYAPDGTIAEGGFQAKHCSSVALFARSTKDIYASFDSVIYNWNGKDWKELVDFGPNNEVRSLAGTTTEVMAVTEDRTVRRKVGTEWKTVPTKVSVNAIVGGNALWAVGLNDNADGVLEKWSGGTWSERKSDFTRVTVSPGGTIFAVQDEMLARSTDDGKTFAGVNVVPNVSYGDVFVRSNTDAYAAGSESLVHFDGTSWKATAVDRHIVHLTGNATTLFALVEREHP